MVGTAIGAAAGIGGAIIGGSATRSAAKTAAKTADANAALQKQIYDTTRSDLTPYTQSGYAAQNALLQRLGLSSGGPAAAQAPRAGNPFAAGAGGERYAANYGTPYGGVPGQQMDMSNPANFSAGAAPQGAQQSPDYGAYLAANPDLQAEWQRLSTGKGAGMFPNAEAYAQWHYENMGQAEGRQLPVAQAAPASGGAQVPSALPGPPLAPTGARPSFSEDQPTYTTPAGPDLSAQAFESSPYFQQGLAETMRNVNARFGARGLLRSGAAASGAANAAADNFRSNYSDWAGRQLGIWQANLGQFNSDRAAGLAQWNQNRNVFNSLYDSDRAYAAGRDDVYTGNLFDLSRLGQSAAAGVGSAGQSYGSAAAANNNSAASVAGNAAIANGNIWSNSLSNLARAAGGMGNPFAVNSNTIPWPTNLPNTNFTPTNLPW